MGVGNVAKRKCPYCSNWIEKDEEYTYHKEYPKRLIHKSCEPLVEEQYQYKLKEEKELASLVDTVAKTHNIAKQMLPKLAYVALQNLRDGRAPFDSVKLGRRGKNGFEFNVIEQCYKENANKINDILFKKQFTDTMSEFKYILIVLINHLPKTKSRMEKEKINAQRVQDNLEKLNRGEDFFLDYDERVKNRKKKDKKKTLDISKYLDDDENVEPLF